MWQLGIDKKPLQRLHNWAEGRKRVAFITFLQEIIFRQAQGTFANLNAQIAAKEVEYQESKQDYDSVVEANHNVLHADVW